jgi:hypothetical protein
MTNTLVKEGGAWLFAERKLHVDWDRGAGSLVTRRPIESSIASPFRRI